MANTIPHAATLCCGECKGEWDPTSQPALAWAGSMTQALPDQGEADAARWTKGDVLWQSAEHWRGLHSLRWPEQAR